MCKGRTVWLSFELQLSFFLQSSESQPPLVQGFQSNAQIHLVLIKSKVPKAGSTSWVENFLILADVDTTDMNIVMKVVHQVSLTQVALTIDQAQNEIRDLALPSHYCLVPKVLFAKACKICIHWLPKYLFVLANQKIGKVSLEGNKVT